MSSAIYILLGLTIMFLGYFIVILGLCSLYFWVAKETVALSKDLLISASLASVGVILGILTMIILSLTNVYIFAFFTFASCFGAYFLLLKYFWKFSCFDAIILSVTLATILNPAWLILIGII